MECGEHALGDFAIQGPVTGVHLIALRLDHAKGVAVSRDARHRLDAHAQPGDTGGAELVTVLGKRQRPEGAAEWIGGTVDAVGRSRTRDCRIIDCSQDQLRLSWLWVAGRLSWHPFGPRYFTCGEARRRRNDSERRDRWRQLSIEAHQR